MIMQAVNINSYKNFVPQPKIGLKLYKVNR